MFVCSIVQVCSHTCCHWCEWLETARGISDLGWHYSPHYSELSNEKMRQINKNWEEKKGELTWSALGEHVLFDHSLSQICCQDLLFHGVALWLEASPSCFFHLLQPGVKLNLSPFVIYFYWIWNHPPLGPLLCLPRLWWKLWEIYKSMKHKS